MAEIRVVRKNASRNRLLFLLLPLALLVGAGAWYWKSRQQPAPAAVAVGADTTRAAAAGAIDSSALPAAAASTDPTAAVTAYATFVGHGEPEMTDSAQMHYAANGLQQLADALTALGGASPSAALVAAVDTMRRQAQQLPTLVGTEPTPMEIAKPAFDAAATGLNEVQKLHPAVDVTPAVETVGGIKSKGSVRSQREKIQTFFDRAATVMQSMLGQSGAVTGADTAIAGRLRGDTAALNRARRDAAVSAERAAEAKARAAADSAKQAQKRQREE